MGNFTEIYEPIKAEIQEIEFILKNIGKNMTTNSTQEVFSHFFSSPGKFLRPTLALLSAKAVNPNLSQNQIEKVIQLSVAVELIHSASLIHDDIIDGDLLRRGRKTLNNVYGRKIAVLAGDTLYAKAFSILSHSLPREAEQIITKVIEQMCVAEIFQAKDICKSQDEYFKLIEGKTACFMSCCCKIGAILADTCNEDVKAMEEFGLLFGMVYQIVDDCIDKDPNASLFVTIEDAQRLAEKAIISIDKLESTVYKNGLINLLNSILSY